VPAFSLRDATAEDSALVFEITREAMRPYVEQTWGEWNDAEQAARHGEQYRPDTHRIVCVRAEAAGVLAVESAPDHVQLVKLYLRAAFRGRGIGSALLGQVIDGASRRRLPVRLRVLRANVGARALYTRHGFRIAAESVERFFMERPPGPAPGTAPRRCPSCPI
jgi:ribosomal protein S18 acetylase RimI-like enzyme